MKNVMDYGAKGDGTSDDREAIQRAIDDGANDETWFPPGLTFRVGAHPQKPDRCLWLGDADRLRGPGRIVQANGSPRGCRVVHVEGSNVRIEDLKILGDGANDKDGQRHGVFATGSPTMSLRNVEIESCSGDGLYIYNGSSCATILSCHIVSHGRNGITLGGGTSMTSILNSCVMYNGAQQIDSEPQRTAGMSDVEGVTISRCEITNSPISDYAITVSGSSAQYLATSWRISDCKIDGPVLVRWAYDVFLFGNEILSSSSRPCVHVDRRSGNVNIIRNQMIAHGDASGGSAIWLTATSPDNRPWNVSIIANDISINDMGQAFAIRVTGARSAYIDDNDISGPVDSGSTAVYVRSTFDAAPIESIRVRDNTTTGFGGPFFIARGTDTKLAKISKLEITGNRRDIDGGIRIEDSVHVDDLIVADAADPSVGPLDAGGPWGWRSRT